MAKLKIHSYSKVGGVFVLVAVKVTRRETQKCKCSIKITRRRFSLVYLSFF